MQTRRSEDPGFAAEQQQAPRLADYSTGKFSRGRSAMTEVLWQLFQWILLSSWLPGSSFRRLILRLFGAHIGQGVVIKQGVRVKFPWRLSVGDDSWIGEDVWIDNLADVVIGKNCCLSQGAYLCTGSHDWTSPTFDLLVKPIAVGEGAWIAAGAAVGPGVTIGQGAVLSLGSVATADLNAWSIYSGSPASFQKERTLRSASAG